jgi:hypothetical protein
MTPRTVVVPGAGGNSLSFAIPPGVDFNVESVLAAVDASAAGDTFGELSVSDQSGVVIATKRQGLPIPGGSSGTETWALGLNDEEAAAAASGFQWCAALGENTAVVSGVTTKISLDPVTLLTNASSVFSIDAGAGYTGLGIHAAGLYLVWWGVIEERTHAPQPANPETIVVVADEGGLETTEGMEFGSNYARGFVNTAAHDQWDPSWAKVIQIVADTGAAPLVVSTTQTSGQDLDCIVSVYAVKLPS